MADISKIKTPDNELYNIKDGSAVASITRSGTTFTATKRDGTTFTFTQQDNNTTYTFATGDNNGQIKVTPSGGTAQNVSVKGLGAAAYKGTTTSVTSGSSDLVTSGAVYTAIDNLPEPMIFKGSLGTGGTITTLPTASSANEGYTYKVITAGTYASQPAKVGDLFISNGTDWIWIPSGDEPSGTVTSITLKATSPIAIDSSSAITTSGTRTLSHANSGVTAGTYRSVTVNATGHVTAGTNPTTLSGYGITDAKIANGVITLGSNTITPLTSHQTVTDNNPTLAWGTKSKVATIGGTAINVTMPANPNTNTTYTIGTSGNNITLTPSSGNVQSITAPYATDAGYLRDSVTATAKLRYINSNDATTWTADTLAATDSIAVIRNSVTGAWATGHIVTFNVNTVGTPFQIGVHDSSELYFYKRYKSSGTYGDWVKMNAGYADSAGSATKATQDGSGNTITSTYVKKSGDTITRELKLYREGTTTQNLGTYLTFQNKDTTTGKTSNGYIIGYDGGENGLNMVLTPGGNMFIGSGEAAQNHYNLYTHSTAENFYATADSTMYLQANGQTIANRVGIAITTDHALIPIKADVGTNNIGSIGTSSYKWANGYFTNINGVAVGSSPKFTDTNNAVTQTATTTNDNYEVLFSNTADNTTRTEGARKSNALIFNPTEGLKVGVSSQSAFPSVGIQVHDVRSVNFTPNVIQKGANFFFSANTMPNSNWWAGLHVKGWEGGYAAWEIVGSAHNNDSRTTPLYVRSSNQASTWGSWRKIYDTSNPPTYSEVGAASSGHNHDSTYLKLTGGIMTGVLTMAGIDIALKTSGSSSDDSSDIAWFYGNGQEKARLWTATEYTTKSGLNYRVYKKDGTSLYSGTIPLADGTGASGTWGISVSGNAAKATTSQYLIVPRVAKDSQSLPGANKCIVEEYSSGTNYNLPSNAYYHIYSSQGDDTRYGCQLALGMNTEAAYYRVYNNQSWGNWKSIINTNTDVNVKVNNTNPTTGTWYYPVWYTGTSGIGNVNANDGFLYYSIQGTASAAGRSILRLGNGTQTGTAGNKYGDLRIYSQKQGYSTLTMASGATAERKHTLPDVAGTIGVFTATPTSGQVVVSDGTAGGFKTTGYTIAKSVPSNAVFTDANVTQTEVSDLSYYEVCLSNSDSGSVKKSSNLQFLPSYGRLQITSSSASDTNIFSIFYTKDGSSNHLGFNVYGEGSCSCATLSTEESVYAGGGIELGMASASTVPFIDFHWNSIDTDYTARLIQRVENTIDFMGKNSGTWGTARAASFSSQSSIFVKENIYSITDDEAKRLLQLRPVAFDYKGDGLKNQRGLIAEEVANVMPEMVIVPKGYTEYDPIEPWNTPCIDYSKFVPYLIKMVQIQQKEIDELKSK